MSLVTDLICGKYLVRYYDLYFAESYPYDSFIITKNEACSYFLVLTFLYFPKQYVQR